MAKTATKNKISRNYNLAHFVLNRNPFSQKIYTAVSDHDTFYQNVCLHLTSTPREANESLKTNINSLQTISLHQQEKGYKNHPNDHQRENALIFYQFLLTNSLRKYTEIGLENMSVDMFFHGSNGMMGNRDKIMGKSKSTNSLCSITNGPGRRRKSSLLILPN